MRIALGIFVISFQLFTVTALANESKNIHYVIAPLNSTNTCVKISVSTDIDHTGALILKAPYIEQDFQIYSKSNFTITNLRDSYFEINASPDKSFDFDYTICLENPYRNLKLPIIEKDRLHFLVRELLVVPDANNDQDWNISMSFINFDPDLSIYSSYGEINKTEKFTNKLSDFNRSVFSVGKFKVYKHRVGKEDISILLADDWQSFTPKKLSDMLLDILTINNHFWQDADALEYFIAVFKEPNQEQKSFEGMHYRKFLSMVIPEVDPKYEFILKVGLSHEFFHHWNGDKIYFEENLVVKRWFLEGFTDYFGLRLPYDANRISLTDYVNIYNRHLSDYYTTPLNDVSVEQLSNSYGRRSRLFALPQYQGHIIASTLQALHGENNKIGSVDGLMHKIYADYQASGRKLLSDDDLERHFINYYGEDIWGPLRDKLQKGELIKPHPQALGPKVKMIEKPVLLRDYGFNLKSMIFDKKIINLTKNSPAYYAGVRENDNVISYDVDLNRPEQPICLTIQSSKGKVVCKFTPTQKEVMLPFFEAKK